MSNLHLCVSYFIMFIYYSNVFANSNKSCNIETVRKCNEEDNKEKTEDTKLRLVSMVKIIVSLTLIRFLENNKIIIYIMSLCRHFQLFMTSDHTLEPDTIQFYPNDPYRDENYYPDNNGSLTKVRLE